MTKVGSWVGSIMYVHIISFRARRESDICKLRFEHIVQCTDADGVPFYRVTLDFATKTRGIRKKLWNCDNHPLGKGWQSVHP